ncbi:LysM repeat protein [Desulfitispora alkaliphila]|uniref:LysM peptidoglycan-binding domain-containing protein n=1 Tax=Desulfitispora alkaliphila TaxID=622674 RepID=UPI003D1C6B8F
MNNNKLTRAKHPLKGEHIPRPPKKCDGKFYTVKPTQTLASIARRFGITVDDILAANPQIVNPDIIFVGQVICIPTRPPKPKPVCDLRVLSLRLLTEAGEPLPDVDGAVQLNANVIVRATFNRPVFRAFFFLEPTGTETCELASLIGINCPGDDVAEILWQVPSGTLGRVYVIGCENSCCAKSEELLVVRNS